LHPEPAHLFPVRSALPWPMQRYWRDGCVWLTLEKLLALHRVANVVRSSQKHARERCEAALCAARWMTSRARCCSLRRSSLQCGRPCPLAWVAVVGTTTCARAEHHPHQQSAGLSPKKCGIYKFNGSQFVITTTVDLRSCGAKTVCAPITPICR
jgi:hypothetical protein